MFKIFSKYKANYKANGQVFPFLIALMCVLIIMVMITVNLGQLGIFKTDVSNAADSAALAGASVLSGTLLGLGLRSDKMMGRGVEVFIAILTALLLGALTGIGIVIGIIMAILMYIAFLVEQWVNLVYARGETRMGWTNAKKTALQYAFNNAGIDDKKPTFEEFLSNAYGITEPSSLAPQQIKDYYDEYLKAESPNARRYAVSGFSKFIADEVSGNGYWKKSVFGEMHPRKTSSTRITQGYGWTDDGKNTYCNPPYYCGLKDGQTNYKARNADDTYVYDNWVETEIVGAGNYAIDLFGGSSLSAVVLLGGLLIILADCALKYVEEKLYLPWPFSYVIDAIRSIIYTIFSLISYLYPLGLCFLNDDIPAMTTNNPLLVRVTRYRKSNDVGLWKFRYGEITSRAASHVFPENGYENITPAVLPTIVSSPCDWLLSLIGGGGSFDWNWFNTEGHLFESGLTYAY